MFGRLFQGRLGFLARSLRGSEWRQLLDYVTPAFLDVMPLSALTGQARELFALSRDTERFERTRARAAEALAEAGVAIELAESPVDGLDGELSALDPEVRRRIGDTALAIYFGQIARREETVLDLRAGRFAPGRDDGVRWAPRPLYIAWDPPFLAALRDLYGGYYRDDPARFDAAFEALHLEPARDVFLSHFGGGEQRAVRFRSEVFHSTFHDAFVACRDAGRPLHRNFLGLGIYLACLYDLLEVLDLDFDVRAAFDRVWPDPER